MQFVTTRRFAGEGPVGRGKKSMNRSRRIEAVPGPARSGAAREARGGLLLPSAMDIFVDEGCRGCL